MGILTGHRINFWGGIKADVCTANNDQNVNGEEVLDFVNASIVCGHSDEELIEMMRTPTEPGGRPAGGWNYYGNHKVLFVDSTVSSQGAADSVHFGDLFNEEVRLLGSRDPQDPEGRFFDPVMVELDPTNGQSTQIFVGGLQIGSDDFPRLLIQHNTVCSDQVPYTDERIRDGESDSPFSSKRSGTFQLFFPKKSIVSYDDSDEDLQEIITDPDTDGIVLRFSMFEMAPLMDTEQQVENYSENKNDSNPSVGRVIGTIGAHYPAETETCPPGRLLINDSSQGVAYANVDPVAGYLSIDMLSAIPKKAFRADRTNFTDEIGPNIDCGYLTVLAGNTIIGEVDPRPDDYYQYGGIVDMPLTAEQVTTLNNNPIALLGKYSENNVEIKETPLRIYSDDRNIYFDGQANISCVVSHLGGPLYEGGRFNIKSGQSGKLSDAAFLTFPQYVDADSGATTISFCVDEVVDSGAGFETLTISLGHNDYFINFRKYPKNDFDIPPGSMITWDQVFEHSLRYFYVVFPAMSKQFDLSDEAIVRGRKAGILARISDEYRDTTLYMPIVRSMTPSQIKLLTDFLNDEPWAPLP